MDPAGAAPPPPPPPPLHAASQSAAHRIRSAAVMRGDRALGLGIADPPSTRAPGRCEKPRSHRFGANACTVDPSNQSVRGITLRGVADRTRHRFKTYEIPMALRNVLRWFAARIERNFNKRRLDFASCALDVPILRAAAPETGLAFETRAGGSRGRPRRGFRVQRQDEIRPREAVGLHGRARLPERSDLLRAARSRSAPTAGGFRRSSKSSRARRARPGSGTSSCPRASTAPASPTSSTRRCAR